MEANLLKIEWIKIKNFRSIIDASFFLESSTILFGKNSSGKSNLISAIKLLSNIAKIGLERTIPLIGGLPAIVPAFTHYSTKNLTEIGLIGNLNVYSGMVIKSDINYSFTKFTYNLILKFNKKTNSAKVFREVLFFEYFVDETLYNLVFNRNSKGKIRTQDSNKKSIFRHLETQIPETMTLLEAQFCFPIIILNESFASVKYYSFETTNINWSDNVTVGLKENGNNLPAILEKIFSNESKRLSFHKFLSYVLEYVQDIAFKPFPKQKTLVAKELYVSQKLTNLRIASKGTLKLLQLITAFFFDPKPSFIVVSEPERYLHPSLFHRIILLIEELTTKYKTKQILLITYNSTFLKYARIKSIRFVLRDKNNSTIIQPPNSIKEIRPALELGSSIDEIIEEGKY